MLEKPDLPDEEIISCLRDAFGLHIAQVTFLPLGWVYNALYRLSADDGTPYLLKLRQGAFNEAVLAIPAFLHAQGIREVIAPIVTTNHALWVHKHGFDWTLYPFFDGKTGFEVSLAKSHWIALGRAMKAVHTTTLPAALFERMPQEAYSPRWRNMVREFHKQVEHGHFGDSIAEKLAAFWRSKCDDIQHLVDRAEQLAQVLQSRAAKLTVCHSDLHGRNVLVGADDDVAIVDWDEPILALKERDLMFIGGGIGGIWNNDQEVAWFYEGYGQIEIDLVALSYYRYERIVVDIAEDAERIFGLRGSVEEREKALALTNQFLPNNVVDIAHRTYQQLSEAGA